jgi:hypothetical protein
VITEVRDDTTVDRAIPYIKEVERKHMRIRREVKKDTGILHQ